MATTAGNDINSIMAGWVDRGPWQYWDTLVVAQAVTLDSSYQFFSVPVGGQDPITSTTKTKLETNMQRGNQFPPPRCLVLQQLGAYFASSMLKADIDAILNGGYLEFRIDEKIFYEGPLWNFPAGVGLSGMSTKTAESAWINGLPAPQYTRRYGDFAKYIAPLQQFSLELKFPGTPPTLATTAAGGVGLRLIKILDGLTDRAVQ